MEADGSLDSLPGAPVRTRELAHLINCLRQGECAAVIGISNIGKSSLLQALRSEPALRACAHNGEAPPQIVLLDFLGATPDELDFYEQLLHATIMSLGSAPPDPTLPGTLKAAHRELLRATTHREAHYLFDEAISTLCRESGRRLVFVLDEFDRAYQKLPAAPLLHLRRLRDRVQGRLSYITATCRRLQHLRADDEELYEFHEPLDPHTLILQPLTQDESHRFIDHLPAQRGETLPEALAKRIIDLSGGHPGLMERLYDVLADVPLDEALVTPPAELEQMLSIRQECQRLWDELETEEHEALLALSHNEKGHPRDTLDPQQRDALESKGLIARQGHRPAIFSPILAQFVKGERERRRRASPRGLRLDEHGRFWVDNLEITWDLSDLQRRLAKLLCDSGPAGCTKLEILDAVYEGVAEGVSDAAIYELIGRLREIVEPDPHHPVYILTVRGRGYRLAVPAD